MYMDAGWEPPTTKPKRRYKFTGMVTYEGNIISVSHDGSSIRYITKRDLQNHHLKYYDSGTIVTLEVFFKNDTPRIGKHISDDGRILDIVDLEYIDPYPLDIPF